MGSPKRGDVGGAGYYWKRHAPRYAFAASLIEELDATKSIRRILDIGMGFEVPLIGDLLPNARIDCMGQFDDERFRPRGTYQFINVDLNKIKESPVVPVAAYDLLVCMEVIEHLYVPPEIVVRYLSQWLTQTGKILITTPNAVWIKNRMKMLRGRNPFEYPRQDTSNLGHIREYTLSELTHAVDRAELECVRAETRGLYKFDNPKDNAYSRAADLMLPSLRRTLILVCQKAARARHMADGEHVPGVIHAEANGHV